MLDVLTALYAGTGFFLISATHSYYCKYFHGGQKELGFPFITKWRVTIPHQYGYVAALLLGLIAFSMFLNYFAYFFADFPSSVSGPSLPWFIGFLAVAAILVVGVSPFLAGGAALKWVLEGSLLLFTLLLILSIPENATTFGQVQFIFSVSGAVLAAIYLFWLQHYIVENEKLDLDSMRDAFDSFEERSSDTWVLWGTVVYFVFSGIYILTGYLVMFVLLNS